MRHLLSAISVLGLLAAGCSSSLPAGQQGLLSCSPFHERIMGVWEDELGIDRVHFILGSNASGHGCFVTLNEYPAWGLHQSIYEFPLVARDGSLRTAMFGRSTIQIDLDDKTTVLTTPDKTVSGRVLRVGRL